MVHKEADLKNGISLFVTMVSGGEDDQRRQAFVRKMTLPGNLPGDAGIAMALFFEECTWR